MSEESACHCGKDGHPLGSMNCPVHGYVAVPKAAYERLVAERDEAKRDADEMADMAKRSIARENRLQIELARVVEKLKLIESECENSLTGRLAAHYYLANIHAMSRSAPPAP